MRLAVPIIFAVTFAAAGCSSGPDLGIRAFSDVEPEYSAKRAKIICESRADQASREASYRARRAIQDGDWGEPGTGAAVADVEKRVYKSRLDGCLAEYGYYREDDEA